MKLHQFKEILTDINAIRFQLPNGKLVPIHFHVTEVGVTKKNYIDCGGKIREEQVINFQLWEADDFDHRIAPQKLKSIVELAEKALHLRDTEIEVEYQMQDTIGKFSLEYDGTYFLLTSKNTNCLAHDKCGIPQEKLKVKLSEGKTTLTCCTPESSCC